MVRVQEVLAIWVKVCGSTDGQQKMELHYNALQTLLLYQMLLVSFI